MAKLRKVVLAYSGGLDTSVALRWIAEQYDCEVVTFCSDVGQGEDLEAARVKALEFGAASAYVADQREEFVRDFVFPAVRASAIYENEYLLGTSLARPCIMRGMMDIVRQEGADAISHGATGKGNDQVRFELAAYHFDPGIQIIAPWREWQYRGRAELLAYLHERGIPFEATLQKKYSVDRNLLHTSYEGGPLEDPWLEAEADTYGLTRPPEQAPDAPRYVDIGFEHGNPVSVDGERLGPVELVARLNEVGGEHAIGRIDLVENRFVGMKSHGVYETPGGTLIHRAHRAVESVALDREAMRLRDDLVPRYASLVYNGFWYAPERVALQQLIDTIQQPVTGVARLKLYKGGVHVVGRKAERSLYRPDVVTFEADDVYDQRDAAGFIRINALRLRIQGEVGQ